MLHIKKLRELEIQLTIKLRGIRFINCSAHHHFNNLIFAFIWVKEKWLRFNYHLQLILFLFYQIKTIKDQIGLFVKNYLKK